jgi:ubiquitin-conjugating enzyme E2 M
MIKVFKKKPAAEVPEEGKEEENKGQVKYQKVKKSPGEIRVKKEMTELDLPGHAQVLIPDPNIIMKFEVHVNLKNEDCLWKGGFYKFSVAIPHTYPHDAPKCMCLTPIYHPNIDLEGNVCLNILRADWKPVLGVNTVILGLIYLFIEPNANDPLNKEAATIMRDNPDSFARKVR